MSTADVSVWPQHEGERDVSTADVSVWPQHEGERDVSTADVSVWPQHEGNGGDQCKRAVRVGL